MRRRSKTRDEVKPTRDELLEEYAYLDGLDHLGWVWEFIRREEKYRKDYESLQGLPTPELDRTEHKKLATKWRMRAMLDPDQRVIPEFVFDRSRSSAVDLSPFEGHLQLKGLPVRGSGLLTWTEAVICKYLQNQEYSLNEIARILYPGRKGSQDERHEPGRQKVRDDLRRFAKLQKEYPRKVLTGR